MLQVLLPFDATLPPLSLPPLSLPPVPVISAPPAAVVSSTPTRVIFVSGPKDREEVIAAWQKLPLCHGKLQLTFDEPLTLQFNRRKKMTSKTHMAKLFISTIGNFCYTFHKVSGYYLSDSEHLSHLISIDVMDDKTVEMVEKCRKLANRIHPNAWDDLKKKLLENPGHYFENHGYTVTNITGKFPDHVITNIRTAFAEKSDYSYNGGYSWKQKKKGRDLRVECKLSDDGIFRAWFSSEFPGCGNGDYWLLVNPTTAIFKERD